MPGVLDAQVVGAPDAKYGEIVVAFIRTRPGHEDMTEEAVRDYGIANMARYKVPKHIFFVDEFPQTASKKVQKFKLRDMAKEFLGREDVRVFAGEAVTSNTPDDDYHDEGPSDR